MLKFLFIVQLCAGLKINPTIIPKELTTPTFALPEETGCKTHLEADTEESTPSEPIMLENLTGKCDVKKTLVYYSVLCADVDENELENMTTVLRCSFANGTGFNIKLKFSRLAISDATFQGLTIVRLTFLQCPMLTLTENAFSLVRGLVELFFEGDVGLVEVPSAVKFTVLNKLAVSNASVSYLDTILQNMTVITVIDFSRNKIQEIHPDAFLNCAALANIDLSNNSLTYLDPNLFKNIRALKFVNLKFNNLTSVVGFLAPTYLTMYHVNLGYNQITSIQDMFEQATYTLKCLYLDGNPLNIIIENDTDNLPKLATLSLTGCALRELRNNSISKLLALEQLLLGDNKLSQLPETIFDNLWKLNVLYLNNNSLVDIGNLFKMTNLEVLDLSFNRIRDIDGAFNALPNLQQLRLSHNEIEAIPNATFSNNLKLFFLELNDNRISSLEPNAFEGPTKTLRILNLAVNRLKDLNHAFSNLDNLKNLQRLWLYNNSLEKLSGADLVLPNLLDLNLKFNKLYAVSTAFVNMHSIHFIYLDFNNVTIFTRQDFSAVVSVSLLGIDDNPLSCDCRMAWLLARGSKIGISKKAKCAAPPWVKGKHFKKLSPRELYDWKTDCPLQCHACQCIANGTEVNVGVNCTDRKLKMIPDKYPINTVALDVSRNNLSDLPRNLSSILPDLRLLSAQQNRIKSLARTTFPIYLHSLDMSRNQLERFPFAAVRRLNLTNTSLYRNPWLCDCEANDFRIWLLNNSHVIQHLNETRCSDNNSDEQLRNKTISFLAELDLCPVMITLYALIAIGVLAVLLTASGGSIGYIRYQMPIKVWLFSHGLCLRWVKEEDLDEDKEFDAFLVFSSEDEHLVPELLEGLENEEPYYRVCVHYRNFPAGEWIEDNIRKAVKASKKILILISRDFIESDWAMLEFREAHNQFLEEKLKRMIFVLVGDLPPNDDIPEDLQAHLQSTTYLKLQDRYFWEKLRFAMPKTAIGRDFEDNPGIWNDEKELLISPLV